MKSRLDDELLSRRLASTLSEARALILAGRIRVEGLASPKAGSTVGGAAAIEVLAGRRFVSRGGEKLDAALAEFNVDVSGLVCMDVGASTGGFTDAFLERGARVVYAIDTGRGQIDARLRSDLRVILRENCNARTLGASDVPEPIDVAAIDVSFISVRAILPAVSARIAPAGKLVVLVKPQFEADRREVPRGGVIRDDQVRRRTVAAVVARAIELDFRFLGEMESPIRGARGNVEIFVLLGKG